MSSESYKITIKLLVDTRSNKVLFAEAGKDFVDFIFYLLTLPLGSVIKLLSPSHMAGSIGKLYQSVNNLKETYFIANKVTLLQPMIPFFDGASPLLLTGAKAMTESKYYFCKYCYKKFTTFRNINCPTCNRLMVADLEFVTPSTSKEVDSEGGFVKGVITYMITDDLEVTPLSAISSITLINRFNIKNDIQLEEKVVAVGMKEGLALLKASLESCTVFTDVFFNNSAKKPTR